MAVLRNLSRLLKNLQVVVLEIKINYASQEEMDYAEDSLTEICKELIDMEFIFSFQDDVVNRILTYESFNFIK